jgi:uncharacterized membrane protein (DUF485 family)
MADKAGQDARFHIPEEHHSRLAHAVMRRQASLSIRVAAVFLIMLFGLPLVNRYMPAFANTRIWGFTATWFFLAVLFYPITWFLSWYFIKASDRIESECHDWRTVLGEEAGEPLEPAGVDDIRPAFIDDEKDQGK